VKATTAGSNLRQASGLGRILRGAFATRGDALAAKGSGASAAGHRLPLAFLLVLVVAMALAPQASAITTHVREDDFGPANQPVFTTPQSVAVDQSAGDVIVMEAGKGPNPENPSDPVVPPSIQRFNADGTPDNFSALGTNLIDGKGGADLTPQDGLIFGEASQTQIAIDNSGGATDGNIYVTQHSPDGSGLPSAINIFSSAGAYLGQLTAAGATQFSEACGVAVDSSGAVYVGDRGAGIHKFVPAANPPVNGDHAVTFTTVANPCALAAGVGPTAGFLFAVSNDPPVGENQHAGPISKIDSGTGELKYVVSPSLYTTVTVDPGTGHVYGASDPTVREFDASGVASATEISNFSTFNLIKGLAVRGSTGKVYLNRSGLDLKLEVFSELITLPNVTTGSATAIAPTSATLNGTINPDGVELTECKFEYGKLANPGYESSVACAQSPAAIGSGTADVPVSADISGLDLGARYRFRLVATNADGTAKGGESTFKLQSTPVIGGTWSTDVVFTEATLHAQINPEGFPTTYVLEWGSTPAYGNIAGEGPVGSDKVDHVVSDLIDGLTPGTTYHFRVVTTNAIGTVTGPDITFTTYEPFAPETNCANQVFRGGGAARLPDCRAYELVTPIDKGGGDIVSGCNGNCIRAAFHQTSTDGEKITYTSSTAFGDQVSSIFANQYIASRGPDGWTSHGINAPQGTTIFDPFIEAFQEMESRYEAFTADLSSGWLRGYDKVPLTSTGLPNKMNLYRRDNLTDTYEALTINEPIGPASPILGYFPDEQAEVQGMSDDGSHSVFFARAALTPNASSGENRQLYEYFDGQLELVSLLPDETASTRDASVGAYDQHDLTYGYRASHRPNAVSDDGSRIFWTAASPSSFGGDEGDLYVRIDGERTVAVSEGGARYVNAAPDGSKTLYIEGGTTGNGSLYLFDVDSETRTLIATGVYGEAAGASEDLSHIYFASTDVLDGGAQAGRPNLYLSQNGTLRFIATLPSNEEPSSLGTSPFHLNPIRHASRVTPDGRYLAFQSEGSLTGYDNLDAITGEPATEVYRYDAVADRLDCVSCNPSGSRPIGNPLPHPYTVPSAKFFTLQWAAASLPTEESSSYSSNVLSDDGDFVFFNSYDPLLPGDTNGAQDVYEWRAAGVNGCQRPDGCLALISTGESPEDSEFVDASASGREVFIRTSSSLLAQDPGLVDIYSARIGGGFPPPPSSPACVGDACQSIPAAPRDPTPASATFRGAGDPKNAKSRRRCQTRRTKAGKQRSKASKQSSRAKRKALKRCRRGQRRAGR
jgi:hypothetical protein